MDQNEFNKISNDIVGSLRTVTPDERVKLLANLFVQAVWNAKKTDCKNIMLITEKRENTAYIEIITDVNVELFTKH